MEPELTLAELADRSGLAARTIRFYIARGLLAGPVKAGRGAMYTAAHLERLEKIKALQAEGRMLSEIAAVLQGNEAAEDATAPTAWWQHAVAPDVYVMARADMSPWRTRQVRAALQHLAALLNPGRSKE